MVLPILSIFSYLSYLGHSSLLGLQTKPEDRATLFSFNSHNLETSMHSAVNGFVHALCKHLQNCAKSGKVWFPWFNHHSVALVQLEPGMKFFHWMVPKNQKFQYNRVVFLCMFKMYLKTFTKLTENINHKSVLCVSSCCAWARGWSHTAQGSVI